jgi:hypothetical protein
MTFCSAARYGFRRVVRNPVLVTSPAGAFTPATGITENVGGGGVLLFLDVPITPGLAVELRFDMPTQAGEGSYPVHCVGEVVRSDWLSGRHAIALVLKKVEVVAGSGSLQLFCTPDVPQKETRQNVPAQAWTGPRSPLLYTNAGSLPWPAGAASQHLLRFDRHQPDSSKMKSGNY